MTTPSIDALATYGGAIQDYARAEDPTCDRPAALANIFYADVAGMTHTQKIAIFRMVLAPGPTAPSWSDFTWQTGAIAVARQGIGAYTATLPATVTDYLGNTQTINIRSAEGWVEDVVTIGFVKVSVTGANTLTINTFASNGITQSDLNNTNIVIAVM